MVKRVFVRELKRRLKNEERESERGWKKESEGLRRREKRRLKRKKRYLKNKGIKERRRV